MLILFDHGTPWPLRRYLTGHSVHPAQQFGWDSLDNGLLIAQAEHAGYELLITTDRNIRYQQNLSDRTIAILVLVGHNWPYSQAAIEATSAVVDEMKAGEYRETEII